MYLSYLRVFGQTHFCTFPTWDVQPEFLFKFVLVAISDNISFAIWHVHQLIAQSVHQKVSLYYWFASNEGVFCVCLPLVNDSAVFVIHHSVFVSCHSLDLFSLECYSSLLNLWLVLRHGVFSGTSRMLSVASTFWESMCVLNNACVCMCVRERV